MDLNGHWVPPYHPGQTRVAQGKGATGTWWVCNGNQVYPVNENALPEDKIPYKTFSVFFSYGFGFRILRGDATNPPVGEAWYPLGFEHDDNDGYSSYLTNVLQQASLRCHRQDQAWVKMLLPNTFHGPEVTATSWGALKGELPIFLALLALSMPHANVPTLLPFLFQNGQWTTHNLAIGSGCTYPKRKALLRPLICLCFYIGSDKRGVVVTVYAVPGWAGGSHQHLQALEEGRSGKYYR